MIDERIYEKIMNETNTDYGVKEENGKFVIADIQSVLEDLLCTIEDLKEDKKCYESYIENNCRPIPTEDEEG